MNARLYKRNNNKLELKIFNEISYILLFIMFFIGILGGSLAFKKVTNFDEYKEELKDSIVSLQKDDSNQFNITLIQGVKNIIIFWVIGMSVIGMPILIGFIGYKGYSLGYSISTVIQLLGMRAGNKYVFQNLFLRNAALVFIMIFLTNYSIKIFKNFLENRENIRIDAIKYTIISTFTCLGFMLICVVENVIL